MGRGAAGERDQATVFGEVAELYDRARPGYPEVLVDKVVASAPESPRVLEVGAGTGKATVLLGARGLEVVALEPSVEMAAVGRRRCAGIPRVEVTVSTFEEWPAEPEAFQLVVSAQAWHWVVPEVRYRKAHDVLAPGGVLALFWNRPLWKDAALRPALDDVYERCAPELKAREPGLPGLKEPEVDEQRATEIEGSGFFGPVDRHSYRWAKHYTAKQYLELLQTQSDHRMLWDEQRANLLGGVADVIERSGGSIDMDYVARLYVSRRLH